MEHHFNIEIATQYGMLEAVLINYFDFWLRKNEANNSNYHDGTYWTFNSIKALGELFPYVSEGKIRNAIKHLEQEGILLTGHYNKNAHDRTTWYAFSKKGKSICQNQQMDMSKNENGFTENNKPIPVNNTDDKTSLYTQLIEDFNSTCVSLPKCMKLTNKRKSHIKQRVADYGIDEIKMAFRKAEESDFLTGRKGDWKASFDWMMQSSDNIAKILEGQYDNHGSTIHDKLKKAFEAIG